MMFEPLFKKMQGKRIFHVLGRFVCACLFMFMFVRCASSQKVYICTGPDSECYHKSSNCWGLNRCSKSIIQIRVDNAEYKGRKPCNICKP